MHAYRDSIVTAIRENPDKRAKALATLLLDRYKVVRVRWDAIKTYIDREKLYDVALAAPVTPQRPVAASGSPIARETSPAPPVRSMPTSNVNIADLPAYRDTIIAAVKANQGMRGK